MSSLAEDIAARLRGLGVEVSGTPQIYRTRAGRHQRSAGAWSWFMTLDGGRCVGAWAPAARIAKGFSAYWDDRTGELCLNPADANTYELQS